MAKPVFDVVTGTSTGALIAPFAYLGDRESTDTVLHTYRNPQKNWVKPRGLFSLLKRTSAYADIPGLEDELRTSLDLKRLARVAKEGEGGGGGLAGVVPALEGTHQRRGAKPVRPAIPAERLHPEPR